MASGSSGHGSSAHGGAPPAAAAVAPSANAAVQRARRFAHLPAADLMGHLIRRNRRSSDFVDVALVLTVRERRLAAAEARARAAEEAAARLQGEMEARERLADEARDLTRRLAAEAQDLTRRLAAAAEERLQAEIRSWQRRAIEAEARLQAYSGGRDHRDIPPPSLWSLTWPAGSALTDKEEEQEAQAEEEEAPLQVAFGKRKETVASSLGKLSKKLKLPAWGGSCSNAVPESEADDTTDEAETEDEDPWPAWDEDRQDALAIIPGGRYDLHDAQEETEIKQQGVGEHDQPEDKTEGELEGFEHEPENLVALAVVTPGNNLPPNDDAVEVSEGAIPEPEASEESKMTETAGDGGSLRKKGMIYNMVLQALKEKERQAILASASQPNLRFWLPAPLPEEPATVEEGLDDDDKGAPQQ